MHATASRHSALSYEHAGKLAAPLKAEAAVLLATAEGGYSGRGVDPGRTGAARRTTEEAGRGPHQDRSPHPDRSPRRRALDPRAGGARGQSRGARGHGEGARQEAWRQAAGAAGHGARTRRPDQSDRRGLPHHAGGGRWLRAMLQRASRGDGGPPVGGRHRCRASRQRRAARTSSKPSRCWASWRRCRRIWAGRRRCSQTMPFQRGQCGGLRCGGDRAAARARPYPASPILGPALCHGAAGASAGWLFSWSVREAITTIIPCLLILGLGYRRVIGPPEEPALGRCARVVAFVGAGWLIGARLVDLFLDNRARVYATPEFWVDARFYLGWTLGLLLAPSPSTRPPQPK